MSNVLSKTKRNQIVALGQLGWSLRQIEKATGVRRETASKYLLQAGVALRPPRHRRLSKPATETITDSASIPKPASQVISDLGLVEPSPPTKVNPSASACESYRELIETALAAGRNAMGIYQDLVTEHGFTARYASVQRYVRHLRIHEHGLDAHPIIQTPPGEEAQVDYGEGPMVRHPTTGKYQRTRLFVLTLGFSRKSVRLLVWKSSSHQWCELHEQAFRRLGGVARVVVLDNLKEGVLKPDIYDPTLNPLYEAMLKHYGIVALPCRVRDPNRKGKVESAVGHAQRTALKGRRFESIEEAQAYLDHWEKHWADTRIHGTTKRQVAAMFAEEQPALRPLPTDPFRYFQHGTRVVALDGCVEVDRAYYHAGPGVLGRRVAVQWDALHVRVLELNTGQLMREHVRQRPGRYRIDPKDLSKKTPPKVVKLIARAHRCGRNVGAVVDYIHQHEREFGVRRVLGILSLIKRYGAAAVDDAAKTALEIHAPSYRFMRRYLERQRANTNIQLKQIDPLIRELTQYRDIIQQRTQGRLL